MKTIQLTRKQVVEASCYLNEAERSLHFVLNPACRWMDFVAYYTPSKVDALKRFARLFQPQPPTEPVEFSTVETIWRCHRPLGIVKTLLDVCFGALKSHWRIPIAEAAVVGTVFDAMLQCLLRREKPTDDQLISSRMSAYSAHQLIASHCPGLRELANVRSIGWFNQMPYQPTRTVADILRDVA